MKEQFIKLTVYLFNAPEDIALDQQQIEDILFSFALQSYAAFLTQDVVKGDHFANYCDMCNQPRLTYRKAELIFNDIFEAVTDPRELDELIPLENKES